MLRNFVNFDNSFRKTSQHVGCVEVMADLVVLVMGTTYMHRHHYHVLEHMCLLFCGIDLPVGNSKIVVVSTTIICCL